MRRKNNPTKYIKRTVSSLEWLRIFTRDNRASGVFFFYSINQIPQARLEQLSRLYDAKGFSWYYLGSTGLKKLLPGCKPAYHFFFKGNFYCLYWPNWNVWGDMCEFEPLLANPRYGLYKGHFFTYSKWTTTPPSAAAAPVLLCGTIQSTWGPLVDTLFLLSSELSTIFPIL